MHSPDWEYPTKVQRLETITWYRRQQPEYLVQLYEDEVTYYRRPTLAQSYAPAGSRVPRAEQGYGSNTARRIAACLDTYTGRLFAWQRAHFDRQTLLRFYQEVEASYPQAEDLFLIYDNWLVHQHPDLVAGLRGSKPTLVLLPTYAPWLNPVEKVWRQLYAEVLHLHPWVDAWDEEQAAVQAWSICSDEYFSPIDGYLSLVCLASRGISSLMPLSPLFSYDARYERRCVTSYEIYQKSCESEVVCCYLMFRAKLGQAIH